MVYNETQNLTVGATYTCTIGQYRELRVPQISGKEYTITVVYTSDSDVKVTVRENCDKLQLTNGGNTVYLYGYVEEGNKYYFVIEGTGMTGLSAGCYAYTYTGGSLPNSCSGQTGGNQLNSKYVENTSTRIVSGPWTSTGCPPKLYTPLYVNYPGEVSFSGASGADLCWSVTAEPKVTITSVAPDDKKLTVYWNVSNITPTSQTVQYKTGSGEYQTLAGVTSSSTYAEITGLTNDTEYTVKVTASDGSNTVFATSTGTPKAKSCMTFVTGASGDVTKSATNQFWIKINDWGTTYKANANYYTLSYETDKTAKTITSVSVQDALRLYVQLSANAETNEVRTVTVNYNDGSTVACGKFTFTEHTYTSQGCCAAPTSATVPSIYIGQKPVVDGTSATINLQLSDWGCEDVDKVKIYHVSSGVPTTSSPDPWEFTLESSKITNTNFSVTKTNIPTGTYYIKAQAHNSVGWSENLSDLASFTISGCDEPTLTAEYNATKSSTSISVDASVTAMGSCGLNAFGVEYSVNSEMSTSQKKSATSVPSAVGTQTVTITDLEPNTKYYYRTYAGLNSSGYAYSPIQNDFTLPTYTTSAVVNSSTSATVSGKINAGGGALSTAVSETCAMEVSTVNDFSSTVAVFNLVGAVGTDYDSNVIGLTAGTTYYYRMKAKFSDSGHQTDWVYSEVKSFTTKNVFTSVTIDATATVCATSPVTPAKSSDPAADSWTFTSSDETVATVDVNGVVTGVAAGSATITATAHKTGYADGSAQCVVTVNATPAKPGDITGTVTELCASTNDYAFSIEAVSGATGYTWSVASGDFTVSGDGTSCTVNTGASYNGGTLQVIATNGCGSSAARTLLLTKVADPTVSLSASAASVCSGSDVTITATVTNVSTFDWSTPTGWSLKAEATKTSATYTTAGTGAQTITYTGYNSCNASASANVSVTANAIPTVSISVSADACGAGNIQFSSSNVTPSGATVKWYDGSGNHLADNTTYTFNSVPAGESRTAKAKAVKDGCESAMTAPLTGSRKVNPVLTITVESTAGGNNVYGWEEATISATTDSGSITSSSITQTTGTGGIISGNKVKGHVDDVFTGSYTATGDNGCTSSGNQTVTVIKAVEDCD